LSPALPKKGVRHAIKTLEASVDTTRWLVSHLVFRSYSH
jgi:hypothetical protein